MGVVDLDGDLVGQRVEVLLRPAVAAQDVLEGRAGQEVLLAQAQLLPHRDLVVRVEHARDVLAVHRPVDRPDVVAGVEVLEVEEVRAVGRPEPQDVDRIVAVARDRHVARHGPELLRVDPLAARAPVGERPPGDVAVHLDRVRRLRTVDLPRRPEAQPVVGLLRLLALVDRLAEHPELVAQAVAHRGDLERRQRVEEARREAPQAAVAQPGVGLDLEELRRGESQLLHRVRERLGEAEVDDAVPARAAGEVLHRQVVGALHVPVVIDLLGGDPAVDEPVADRGGRAPVLVVQRRPLGVLRQRVLEVVGDGQRQCGRVHAFVVVALEPAAGRAPGRAGDLFVRLRLGAHLFLSRVKGSASGTGMMVPRSASLTG